MPRGWVTTARGEALDLDALKNAANLPIAKAKQTKTEVTKRVLPRKPVNIRGNMPAQGEHKPKLAEVETKKKRIDPEELPQKSAVSETGKVEKLADITGIKVKPTDGAIERAKQRAAKGDVPPEEAANEALGEILGDLKAAAPNVVDADNDEVGADVAADTDNKTAKRRTRKTSE